MKKLILMLVVGLVSMLGATYAVASYEENTEKIKFDNSTLRWINWQDVSSDESQESAPLFEDLQVNNLRLAQLDKPVTFELGLQTSYVKINQEEIADRDGLMYGVQGAVTYRQPNEEGIMARAELSGITGDVDYKKDEVFEIDDIDNFIGEGRLLVGYDFYPSKEMRFTPYVGGGFEYWRNEQGIPFLPYLIETTRAYVPVGGTLTVATGEKWDIELNGEYDHIVYGQFVDHLNELNDRSWPKMNLKLDDGYGIRASLKLVRHFENYDFFVEPFFKYWNIEQSEEKEINGTPSGYSDIEYAYTMSQYGLKMGFRF